MDHATAAVVNIKLEHTYIVHTAVITTSTLIGAERQGIETRVSDE